MLITQNLKKLFSSHFNGCVNLAEIFKKKKIESFIQIEADRIWKKFISAKRERSIFSEIFVW